MDSDAYRRFRYYEVTTPEGVVTGLEEVSSLMKRYGRSAFDGDPQLFAARVAPISEVITG